MFAKRVAAGAAMACVFWLQPAGAGPLGFGLSIGGGGSVIQAWHEPQYLPYPPPPGYYAPPPAYQAPALLQPGQIERALRRSGYSQLAVVALRGPIYTVQGIDPWDNYVEMQVSGHDGRVLHSEVIEARLYDMPFGQRPPFAAPAPPPAMVTPQPPRGATPQPEQQLAIAPLPRVRPDYRPPSAAEAPRPAEPVPAAVDPTQRPTDPARSPREAAEQPADPAPTPAEPDATTEQPTGPAPTPAEPDATTEQPTDPAPTAAAPDATAEPAPAQRRQRRSAPAQAAEEPAAAAPPSPPEVLAIPDPAPGERDPLVVY